MTTATDTRPIRPPAAELSRVGIEAARAVIASPPQVGELVTIVGHLAQGAVARDHRPTGTVERWNGATRTWSIRLTKGAAIVYVPSEAIDRYDARMDAAAAARAELTASWTAAQLEDEEPELEEAPLVIVPCGGEKLDRVARAGELYVGQYHRACRRAADALGARRVLILSAKYGLLDLEAWVAPYELRMGQAGSVTPDQLELQALLLGEADATRVVVLAGKAYADAATAVWPHAERPLDGCAGIGYQRQRLARIAAQEVAA